MPYLMQPGEGKVVAFYTRSAEEDYCRAELLMLYDDFRVEAKFAPHQGQPVLGFYDIDSNYTNAEFLRSYRNRPGRRDKFEACLERVRAGEWTFPWQDSKPGEPPEGASPSS